MEKSGYIKKRGWSPLQSTGTDRGFGFHLLSSGQNEKYTVDWSLYGDKEAFVKALFAVAIENEIVAEVLTETMGLLSDADFVGEMKALGSK